MQHMAYALGLGGGRLHESDQRPAAVVPLAPSRPVALQVHVGLDGLLGGDLGHLVHGAREYQAAGLGHALLHVAVGRKRGVNVAYLRVLIVLTRS